MKNLKPIMAPLMVVLPLYGTAVLADDRGAKEKQTEKELDITMTVVDKNANPGDLIQLIELPSPPLLEIKGQGRETATTAREQSSALAAEIGETTQIIRDTATDLSGEASAAAEDAVKDIISNGDAEELPGEIIDNLPPEVELPIDPDVPDAINEVGDALDTDPN